MSTAIHYAPAFAPHPVKAADCDHPSTAALNIGLRIETHKRKRGIRVDGTLCMDCGTETTGSMSPADALVALWGEYGWHYRIGKRLCQLSVRVARQMRRDA